MSAQASPTPPAAAPKAPVKPPAAAPKASGVVGSKKSPLGRIATHGVLAFCTILTLYPLMIVLRIAFSPGSSGANKSLSPIPKEWSIDNFAEVVSATSAQGEWLFGRQLLNSVVISIATTVLGIFLATTAAYAFSRFRFPGRKSGLMAFLVSQMFPGVLMMVPLYMIMQAFGLLNASLGLIIVYATTAIPFCVWMLKGYFDTIPKELEESAIMDGAPAWRIVVSIFLPVMAPALAATGILAFILAWNEFLFALTFTLSTEQRTVPVAIALISGATAYELPWGRVMAASVIVTVPLMALVLLLQRRIVSGLTAGAIKG